MPVLRVECTSLKRGGESKPAKATKVSSCVSRLTSPISAIICDPVIGPVPLISIMTSNSCSSEASLHISPLSASVVFTRRLSCHPVGVISSFVPSFFLNVATDFRACRYIFRHLSGCSGVRFFCTTCGGIQRTIAMGTGNHTPRPICVASTISSQQFLTTLSNTTT